MEYIKVATITKPHGIKGEVKLIEANPECFNKKFKAPLFLENGNEMIPLHLKSIKMQNDRFIVGFKEYDNINQVLTFNGRALYADKASLAPLNEGEFFIEDLIGMDVYNEAKEYLGEVTDVIKYPQCFYFEILHGDKKFLVPFVDEFIISIQDVIIVHEMEGLFA